MKTFEEQYQAQFENLKLNAPVDSQVFADGKVFKVIDYVISGNHEGVVAVDRQGNEKELYQYESVKFKVCGRCGGSGRYSYCEKYGHVCFGCSGVGKQMLAPTGFPQRIKAVCTLDLTKFNYFEGDEVVGEFVGFSKSGGTPLYHLHISKGKYAGVANNIMHSTILKHFKIK